MTNHHIDMINAVSEEVDARIANKVLQAHESYFPLCIQLVDQGNCD